MGFEAFKATSLISPGLGSLDHTTGFISKSLRSTRGLRFMAFTGAAGGGGAGATFRGALGATERRRGRLWTSRPWSRLELGSLEMADQCFTKKIDGSQCELLEELRGVKEV